MGGERIEKLENRRRGKYAKTVFVGRLKNESEKRKKGKWKRWKCKK